jgi:sulfhydrogenase subunit alpha
VSHRYDRAIDVEGLARVEGEGSLRVRVRDGRVEDVELRIYEPPRFFEALLVGRDQSEPPDITARICGICPAAYQMSAVNAIEAACGVVPTPEIVDLRRLLYCGEWIESHALHIYFLHAPDFLGYDGAVEMATHHRREVERGLALRKAGNAILETVGGRAVHPINVRLGGFYRAPPVERVRSLLDLVGPAREAALETLGWAGGFDIPQLHTDVPLLGLVSDDRYPMESGEIATSDGMRVPVAAFEELVAEEQVERSTALHGRLADGRTYLTGPLARHALNSSRLPPDVVAEAARVGLDVPCRNPFASILVRSLELLYACDEAIRLIEAYRPPSPPSIGVPPGSGVGHGATEAPRGVLYHRYELDAGTITAARIVPPTAQNQRAIEADLRRVVEENLDLDDGDLTWRCEQAIRNHDPCISCATHFLRLEVERS